MTREQAPPARRSEPCLALSGVSKRFGNLAVLEEVSFAIRPGERCGIIGPNGAGKSTLFNIIAGELPLTRGSVHFLGSDVTRTSAHGRARRGFARTFQTTTLFPKLTVVENLVLALQAHSAERFAMLAPRSRYRARDEEALELLEHVGLASRRSSRSTRSATARNARSRSCSHSRNGRSCCCSTSRRPASRRRTRRWSPRCSSASAPGSRWC